MVKKYCKMCGGEVDLRKIGSSKIKKEFAPVNPRYGFLCSSECRKRFYN